MVDQLCRESMNRFLAEHLSFIKLVSEFFNLEVIRVGPELIEMRPSSVRHGVTSIVPVILTFVWMVHHHSVRVVGLADGNSDCSSFGRVVCPEITITAPSAHRHLLMLIVPIALAI